MRRPLVALALLLPLLALSAGCLDILADELEEDRAEARRRARQAAPQESTGPGDDAPSLVTPSPTPTSPTSVTTPTAPAPTGPWPREGSHVRYALHGGQGDADERTSWATQVNLTYDGRAWSGTCEGVRTQRHADGRVETSRSSEAVTFTPLGPAGLAKGQTVVAEALSECDVQQARLIVQGLYPEDTTRAGQPVRTSAWWADEGPDREAERDEDAWWDARTRLLLRWELVEFGEDRAATGRLVDTDAPLG